jgi:hypothetical protein
MKENLEMKRKKDTETWIFIGSDGKPVSGMKITLYVDAKS